jgi:hypothetical protein
MVCPGSLVEELSWGWTWESEVRCARCRGAECFRAGVVVVGSVRLRYVSMYAVCTCTCHAVPFVPTSDSGARNPFFSHFSVGREPVKWVRGKARGGQRSTALVLLGCEAVHSQVRPAGPSHTRSQVRKYLWSQRTYTGLHMTGSRPTDSAGKEQGNTEYCLLLLRSCSRDAVITTERD